MSSIEPPGGCPRRRGRIGSSSTSTGAVREARRARERGAGACPPESRSPFLADDRDRDRRAERRLPVRAGAPARGRPSVPNRSHRDARATCSRGSVVSDEIERFVLASANVPANVLLRVLAKVPAVDRRFASRRDRGSETAGLDDESACLRRLRPASATLRPGSRRRSNPVTTGRFSMPLRSPPRARRTVRRCCPAEPAPPRLERLAHGRTSSSTLPARRSNVAASSRAVLRKRREHFSNRGEREPGQAAATNTRSSPPALCAATAARARRRRTRPRRGWRANSTTPPRARRVGRTDELAVGLRIRCDAVPLRGPKATSSGAPRRSSSSSARQRRAHGGARFGGARQRGPRHRDDERTDQQVRRQGSTQRWADIAAATPMQIAPVSAATSGGPTLGGAGPAAHRRRPPCGREARPADSSRVEREQAARCRS